MSSHYTISCRTGTGLATTHDRDAHVREVRNLMGADPCAWPKASDLWRVRLVELTGGSTMEAGGASVRLSSDRRNWLVFDRKWREDLFVFGVWSKMSMGSNAA